MGVPNSGKSTLFNALTGLASTTGNWPGTSMDVEHGRWRGRAFDLVDVPGAYSLDPSSDTEAVASAVLESERLPDVVVVVVDAAHLSRSLYLPVQIRELPVRCVIALTMVDIAASRNVRLDVDALAGVLGCPVVAIDPRRRAGLDQLGAAVSDALASDPPFGTPREVGTDPLDLEDARFAVVDAATRVTLDTSAQKTSDWSDRIDQLVTHRVGGPLIFLGVMWLVFQLAIVIAEPLQDLLGGLISGPISDGLRGWLFAAGLSGSWVEGLLVDGLLAGVGVLLTYVPMMTLMFLLLALLEDSGYMARGAIVTDRVMRMIGLPGKAFLPLVVGFGCNVPAITATRLLTDRSQRLLTSLLIPLTSCSGRLTVYVMVGTTFFGRNAGTVVFAMYVVSILFVVGVGLLLRKTLWRSIGAEPMVLDLPPYQRPTLAITAAVTWARLGDFLRAASGIIVLAVAAVWLLQSIPVGSGSLADVPVADSLYGVIAHAVAVIFVPTGFGAWEVVAGLGVGFIAKEAIVTSWAQTFAASGGSGDLGAAFTAALEASSGGHLLPAVIALLVFVVSYLPCVITVRAQWREIGGRWTLFGMAANFVVAWLVAVAVFQVGRQWW